MKSFISDRLRNDPVQTPEANIVTQSLPKAGGRKAKRLDLLMVLVLAIAFSGCAREEDIINKHMEKAKEYKAKNEFKAAEIELKNVVQLDPHNDTAYYDLGEIYTTLMQKGLAAQAYENAVSANPENLKAQVRLGQIFLARGEILEARKKVKILLEKRPEDVEVLNLLAGIQIQEKNTDAAVITLQRAVSINDANKDTHMLLGGLLLTQGKAGEAETAFQRVLSIDSSEPIAYLELIRLAADKNQWDSVSHLLNQLIGISKNRYDFLARLGVFFEHHQKWDMAEMVYQKAVAAGEAQDPAPLMNLGTYYARRQLNDRALETMQKALEKKPDDPNILSFIAKTHFDLDHIERAKESADRALQKDPQHELANYIRGRVYFLNNDYTSAIERFDQTIKAAPGNALAYYYKALSLLAGKDAGNHSEADLYKAAAGFWGDDESWGAELAINNLERVLALDPGMLRAKLLLAELYLSRRDESLARKQIEAALTQDPDNPRAIVLLAGLMVLERDWPAAINLCKKIIEKNKGVSDGYILLGMIYSMTDRPVEALSALEKALIAAPGTIHPIKLMVNIYLGQNRFDEALSLCNSHEQNFRNDPARIAEIENIKGTIFLARGHKQTAVEHLQKAIAVDPKSIEPHFTLAELYFRESKLEQAMAHFQTVLQLDEKNVAAAMMIGDIHFLRKENQEAEDFYRRAFAIKSGYGPAANNIAFLLSGNENKLDEAQRFAEISVRKMPQNSQARDTMGWIYHRQGNYSRAIDEFEQSLAIDPKNALAHYHMGVTYYKKGEFEKSRLHIKKALALDPNFIGADEAKVMLDE